MKKIKFALMLFCMLSPLSMEVWADSVEIDGLTISKVRAVGNYVGDTFDNTLEIWFTTNFVLPAGFSCATSRVEIDKADQHMITAAYLAFTAGKKVNINIDSSLPNRGGMCQISFLDVVN